MHEMSIALRIVDIARAAIPPGLGEVRVEIVSLQIGKLTAIVPDSLRFCFEVVAQDTPLAGARLAIEEIPIVAVCEECAGTSTIEEPPFACASCGSPRVSIRSGRELSVMSIEIADPDEE